MDAPYTPPVAWTPPAIVAKWGPTPPTLRTPLASPSRTGYPIRGGWWSGFGSWHHLTTGVHRGKFPTDWLRQLTWSELQSLHSSDHEGTVDWRYVPRK